MHNYLKILKNNLNLFKEYNNVLSKYNTILIDKEVNITKTEQVLYRATKDIENITLDILFEINDVTVLQDSQIRLPCGYNDSVGGNYPIHLGKNIFTINETITKGDYINVFTYSKTGNHPTLNARIRIRITSTE